MRAAPCADSRELERAAGLNNEAAVLLGAIFWVPRQSRSSSGSGSSRSSSSSSGGNSSSGSS
eukprot:4682549-Heterocapsa_arctica.AAC.1